MNPQTTLIEKLLTLPVIAFLRRYWMLTILFALAIFAAADGKLFDMLGTLVYLAPLAVGAFWVNALICHIFFRTIDKYVDEMVPGKSFSSDWEQLSPEDRVFGTLFVRCVIFIGCCIIAQHLWK